MTRYRVLLKGKEPISAEASSQDYVTRETLHIAGYALYISALDELDAYARTLRYFKK